MKNIQKDLEGAYNLIQLVMLLLIFPTILVWIWTWTFQYNAWQKLFTACWVVFVAYLLINVL